VVLEQDAVPSEHLAGLADRLTHPNRANRLGKRRVLVAQEPASCSCETRTQIAVEAVMLPSIRTSRSCTSWKPAIGRPNCSRSPV
jgi:hypothetical protein